MTDKATDDKLEAATIRGGDGTATFTVPTTAGPAPREEVQRTGLHDRSEDGDQDGLSDDYERKHGTNPNHYDSDDDGVSDGDELLWGTDALNPDSDRDGVSDGDERTFGSNPLERDSDGDGFDDGTEYGWGFPNAASIPTPSTATADDVDGDGVPNVLEKEIGTSPVVDGSKLAGGPGDAALVREYYEQLERLKDDRDTIGDAAERDRLGLEDTPEELEQYLQQAAEDLFSDNVVVRHRTELSFEEHFGEQMSPATTAEYDQFIKDVEKAQIDRDPKAFIDAQRALGIEPTPADIENFINPRPEDIIGAGRQTQLLGQNVPEDSALAKALDSVFGGVMPGAITPTNTIPVSGSSGGSTMTSPTSSTSPSSPNSPSPAGAGGDQTDANSPSDWPVDTGDSGSGITGSSGTNSGTNSGTGEGPGVARVFGDATSSADGSRTVAWEDTNGNRWLNTTSADGTSSTEYLGTPETGLLPRGASAPTTPPPPPPPAAAPAEEKDEEAEEVDEEEEEEEKEDEEEEEEEEEEEDEEDEEGEGMVNPDADTGGGSLVSDTDTGPLQPDYGSSTGAGVTDGGRGDLGLGVIEGEIRVRNTAGPDIDPDADTGASGLVGSGGTLVPDYGSSTGAGVTDGGRGDLLTGLGPIEPPTDDGVNPYASDAESFGGRGTVGAGFDAEIGGFEQLGDAARDIELGAGGFEATEQEPTPGFGEPADDMFG